jgi:hypothetical protein
VRKKREDQDERFPIWKKRMKEEGMKILVDGGLKKCKVIGGKRRTKYGE